MKNNIKKIIEPIKRSLDYHAIGRKLLMVDELPQGAMARYERDVEVIIRELRREQYKKLSCYGKRVFNKRFPNWAEL